MNIKNITKNQKQIISKYNNNWLETKLKCYCFNKTEAINIIQKIYQSLEFTEPKIVFCNNPYESFQKILSGQQLGNGIVSLIENQILFSLKKNKNFQIDEVLGRYLWFELHGKLETQLVDNIENILENFWQNKRDTDMGETENEYLDSLLWIESKLNPQNKYKPEVKFIYNCISLNVWASYGSYFDFCISILNCTYNQQKWNFFKILTKYFGWIFPYENICLISTPPCYVCTDSHGLLHAENTPAIKFLDGYSLYATHGIIIKSVV